MTNFLLRLRAMDFGKAGELVRKVDKWLTDGAEWIHRLPDRGIAFCRRLPDYVETYKPTVLAWMEKKGITQRLKPGLPIALAALVLPFCIVAIQPDSTNYILLDHDGPRAIIGTPDFEMQTEGLTVSTDDSGRDAQLVLAERQRITVKHPDGKVKVVTRQETVASLLRRLHIDYGDELTVVVDVTGDVPAIVVESDFVYERKVTTVTQPDTIRTPDNLARKGEETLVSVGQTGKIVETYRDTYHEGKLVSSEMIHRSEVTPVNTQVVYGTRVDEVSRDDRIESVYYNNDGSGYLVFRSGESMTFSERVTCEATAYSIGSWTASGLPTKVGHIAVDPTVFPYHTRFYIYTDDGYLVYGNAVAADCGTAIKGYKIDLWFETFDEACDFGRRNCTVFVLN